MATRIVINRKKEWVNRVQQLNVFIDGAERGTVANGSSEEYQVDAGTHTVQGKISWFRSAEITVHVNEGETKFVRARSGMKYYGVAYVVMLVVLISGLLIRSSHIAKPAILSVL